MTDMTNHPSFARTGLTWDEVERLCEASDAVESYDFDEDGNFVVEWVGGESSTWTDGQQIDAANAVRMMSA